MRRRFELRTRTRADARPRSRGQVLAITGLFMAVLLGFTALAVDYGTYLLARRHYQNVADAAAIAGSTYMSRPVTAAKQDQARLAAWTSLQTQLGFPDAIPGSAATLASGVAVTGGWTVWIATPPTAAGAAYRGNSNISGSNSVWVQVQKQNPSFLARYFGVGGRNIDGWATAGNQPSRWAVLALCTSAGPCPANVESIVLAGTNTTLRVIDGDMGSNWGFRINSNGADRLQLPGDSRAYIAELVPSYCGASTFLCYPNPNVSDGSGTAKLVQTLPAMVADPAYPSPSWIDDTAGLTPAVPWRGDLNHDVTVPNGTGTVTNPSGTNVGCAGGFTRIGPGRYRDLDIRANSCVILDPTFGLTNGQRPGIYVITRNFNIGNDSFVIGDGVTIFWTDTAADFNPGGGIVVNNGNASQAGIPAGEAKYGAWTSKGVATWTVADLAGATTWSTPPTTDPGLAFYVRPGVSTTTIFNMSGTSPLMFKGILYGPMDNVGVSGSGSQAAVGQIVGWTVTYNGNTTITQQFDGPSEALSLLLEPRTGQPD
jgi:putative Flp pilus-assembly TadE/G-like protein